MLVALAACDSDRHMPPAADNAVPAIAAASIVTKAGAPDAAGAPAAAKAGIAPPPASRAPAPPPTRATAADYRAIGTEPFWSVTIERHAATLDRPDHAPATFSVVHVDNGGARSWSGDGFALRVTPGPCSDGMSDAIWSDTVQVSLGAGTLKGCGGTRDDGGEGRR
ncbi:MAG: membrane-like protein [Sphingobium sp.]